MLQLQVFVVLPQTVVLLGERDVSCLQVLQQTLAVVEPVMEMERKHPKPTGNTQTNSTAGTRWVVFVRPPGSDLLSRAL